MTTTTCMLARRSTGHTAPKRPVHVHIGHGSDDPAAQAPTCMGSALLLDAGNPTISPILDVRLFVDPEEDLRICFERFRKASRPSRAHDSSSRLLSTVTNRSIGPAPRIPGSDPCDEEFRRAHGGPAWAIGGLGLTPRRTAANHDGDADDGRGSRLMGRGGRVLGRSQTSSRRTTRPSSAGRFRTASSG